jgi:hypothetical protein
MGGKGIQPHNSMEIFKEKDHAKENSPRNVIFDYSKPSMKFNETFVNIG